MSSNRYCLLFLLAFPLWSAGQIVNIERHRLSADTNGWFGDADLTFSAVKVERPLYSVANNAQVVWRQDRHQLFFIGNMLFIKSPGLSFANSGFLHVRYQNPAGKKLMGEALYQVQYNKLLKVNFRNLVGVGGRLELVRTDNHDRLFFGATLMHEYEIIRNREQINTDLRWSFYLAFAWKPLKQLEINSTSYYQPVLADAGDYRLSTENTILYGISERIQFKFNYLLFYDSNPPPNTVHQTYTIMNGLRYKF